MPIFASPAGPGTSLEFTRATFPNVQFIVTAHSPLVVAGARGGEVAVLAPANGRFKVEAQERHFIGATFEELYTVIFGVEHLPAMTAAKLQKSQNSMRSANRSSRAWRTTCGWPRLDP